LRMRTNERQERLEKLKKPENKDNKDKLKNSETSGVSMSFLYGTGKDMPRRPPSRENNERPRKVLKLQSSVDKEKKEISTS